MLYMDKAWGVNWAGWLWAKVVLNKVHGRDEVKALRNQVLKYGG